MKFFCNDRLYVEREDLNFEALPEYLLQVLSVSPIVADFAQISDPYAIDFLDSREYIVSYDDVVTLSDQNIDKILEIYLNRLRIETIDCLNGLFNNIDYDEYRILFYRRFYESYSKYKDNRKKYDTRINEVFAYNEREKLLRKYLGI